jgi:poly(A) polymerase
VATFRSDDAYIVGRHPVAVHFSSPEDDARRRDFTINGLFFDPVAERVIDFVGGEGDLHDGIIRAIGDPRQRFAEDKLRLLRAVRFAARFQFQIEPATVAAIREMADQITVVSAERIADELRKMLTHEQRANGIHLAVELELSRAIVPEMTNWPGAVRVLAAFAEPVTFPLALAAILHALSPDAVANICDRLRLSNSDKERIGWLVRHQAALVEATKLPKSAIKPFLAHDGIDELLALHRALARAAQLSEQHVDFCEQCLRDWPPEVIDPPSLITGDDLRALGLTPGPKFKELLDAVRRAQLDEEINTQDQGIELVHDLLKGNT